MSINSVSGSYDYNAAVVKNNANTSTEKASEEKTKEVVSDSTSSGTKQETTGAVYEKSKEETTNVSSSKNSVYDRTKVQQMLDENTQKVEQFKTLIQSIVSKQGNKSYAAGMNTSSNLKNFFSNLQVDANTIAQAKADVADDGYWGVDKTSERILDFAKAIAGNDPDNIQKMRDAVEKGFGQAAKMWGDELPEISQKTYDKVMSGFDEWEKSVSQTVSATDTDSKA